MCCSTLESGSDTLTLGPRTALAVSCFLARHLGIAALISGLVTAACTYGYNTGMSKATTVYGAIVQRGSPEQSAVLERDVSVGWDACRVRPLWNWSAERIVQRLRREFSVDEATAFPSWAMAPADRYSALSIGRVRIGWPWRAVRFDYWIPSDGATVHRRGAILMGKLVLPYFPCIGLMPNLFCFAVLTAVIEGSIRNVRQSRRLRRGQCPSCGYDLAGMKYCAECGWRPAPKQQTAEPELSASQSPIEPPGSAETRPAGSAQP